MFGLFNIDRLQKDVMDHRAKMNELVVKVLNQINQSDLLITKMIEKNPKKQSQVFKRIHERETKFYLGETK